MKSENPTGRGTRPLQVSIVVNKWVTNININFNNRVKGIIPLQGLGLTAKEVADTLGGFACKVMT